MTRLIAAAASLVVLSATFGVPTAFAGAAHTEFESIVFLTNPCNGEFVIGTGPTKIVYVESADETHFVVHWTFKVKSAVGDQGNSYNMSFIADAQFTAPSGGFDNVTFFDVPVHSEIITKANAPNFDFDLGDSGVRRRRAGHRLIVHRAGDDDLPRLTVSPIRARTMRCGCPAPPTGGCVAVSAGLAPPEPAAPIE